LIYATAALLSGAGERSERADGGLLRYRIRSPTALWKKGEAPRLEVEILEGDPKFAV
jgi:hypothetical protein